MMAERYLKPLFEGRKRTTIRPGVLKIADKVYIHSKGRIVALAEVESVAYKRVFELTDEDARLDGFKIREELIGFLKRRYPGLRDDTIVTIIRFGTISKVDIAEDAHYGGLTPVEVATLALNKLILSKKEQEILRTVIQTKSLRKAALKLFGTIEKRSIIRRVLKKVLRKLKEEDLNGGLS